MQSTQSVEDTVAAVTDVLDCEEHHDTGILSRRKDTGVWSKLARRVKHHPSHFVYYGAEAVALVALVVLTIVFAADSAHRIDRCVRKFTEFGCMSVSDDCVLIEQKFSTSPQKICWMEEARDYRYGTAAWYWTLFFALYPALDFLLWPTVLFLLDVGRHLLPTIYTEMYALHDEVVHLLRQSALLGLWFLVMREPLQLARDSKLWNKAAAEAGKKQVWNDRLLDLHIHMWRVLTVLVILWGMLLVREAIVQALSRQFHQTRRFDQLTRAIVYESVLEKLIRAFLARQPDAQMDALKAVLDTLETSGEDNDMDVIDAKSRIMNRTKELEDEMSQNGVDIVDRERHEIHAVEDGSQPPAHSVVRLHSTPHKSEPTWQRTLTSHTHSAPAVVDHARRTSDTRAQSMLMRKLKRRVRKKAIVEEAREALDYLNQDFNLAWWVRVMEWLKIKGCGMGFGVTRKALKFTESRSKLLGELLASHLRVNPFLRGLNNEKLKNRIQARHVGFYLFWFLKEFCDANPEPTSMSNYPAHWSTDEACMQRNIPALKKLVHEGDTQALRAGEEAALTGEEQTRRDRHSEEQALSAWDLLSGVVERGGELVALSTAPVATPSTGAAGADGRRSSQVSVGDPIPETHAVASAAPMLTEGRDKVTLSGVIAAVEQVYERRKALSLTQMENKSVIAQVGGTMGLMIVIMLAFIAPAFWAPDDVRRIVSSLSAVLLSLTFVFSNTIRELFENAIFLLFSHPFDVGDDIKIDKVAYKVKYIALPYVNLVRTADDAFMQISTTKIRESRIHNVNRSKVKPRTNASAEQATEPENSDEGHSGDTRPSEALQEHLKTQQFMSAAQSAQNQVAS